MHALQPYPITPHSSLLTHHSSLIIRLITQSFMQVSRYSRWMDTEVREREAKVLQRGALPFDSEPETGPETGPGSPNAAGQYDKAARLFYTQEAGVHPPKLSITSVIAPTDKVLVLVHVDLTPGACSTSTPLKIPLPLPLPILNPRSPSIYVP